MKDGIARAAQALAPRVALPSYLNYVVIEFFYFRCCRWNRVVKAVIDGFSLTAKSTDAT